MNRENPVRQNQADRERVSTFALPVAVVAVLASGLHFWPFENNRYWQTLNLSNVACLVGLVVLAVSLVKRNDGRLSGVAYLPHVSVFAYLIVNALSIAFAAELGRSLGFAVKLTIVLVGGVGLFRMAVDNRKNVEVVFRVTTAATILAVTACVLARLLISEDVFGFHSNQYKYASYVGILAPLSITYLFSSRKRWMIGSGMLLIVATYLSSSSMGVILALSCGLLAAVVLVKGWTLKGLILVTQAVSVIVLVTVGPVAGEAAWEDFRLTEADGQNLRQRYIEWQAEVNLLSERGVTGTGGGCINDHRSSYYYRLPKLNTLKSFDQNGWLAAPAETGIWGLVTFVFIVVHYGRLLLRRCRCDDATVEPSRRGFAVATFAGLVSACVANIFCSVQYNGVLITFALVLALASDEDKTLIEERQ